MIEQNVKSLLKEIPKTNPFGESVTLVAAVKLQAAEDINRAVAAGITDIGDNHVQELKDKFDDIKGNPRRHFIGHLQTNKIKYLLRERLTFTTRWTGLIWRKSFQKRARTRGLLPTY